MGKCVVKDCDSKPHKHNKEVKFHTVPKDASRRQKWIDIVRILRKEADWLPNNTAVVCSKHFKCEDEVMKIVEDNEGKS